MAKITYGSKGNIKKETLKKEKEKEKEKLAKEKESKPKPKRTYTKKQPTKEILDSISTKTLLEDEDVIEVIEIPEHLRDKVSEEDKLLYDNSYIAQEVQAYLKERDELDMHDYNIKSLQERLDSTEKGDFTEWDFKIGDPIPYFDPSKSYELTGYRPINETQGLDFNPDWFRQDAITKMTTGKYQEFSYAGAAYAKFWMERIKRCTEGYTYNGYTLTGWNYFYLNFYKMKTPALVDGKRGKRSIRKTDFPLFIAAQYEYFHYLELAKRLNLDAIVLKGRGLGFSEMGANNGVAMYTCEPETQSMYTAATKDYVDRILEKCWAQLDYLNTETEGGFKHLRQAINTQLQKKSSFKDKEGNEFGFGSTITGVVADKASKVRGDRTELLIYEEAGSDALLKKKWIQGDALVKVGGQKIGFKMAFGTGGDEGPQLADLEEMFLDPTSCKVLPYKHNHTPTGEYVVTAYFIPSTAIILTPGFMDERGVTNSKKAKEYLASERKVYENDPHGYMMHCAEYCWYPEEALSRKGSNTFNQELIALRLTDIKVHGAGIKPKKGIVDYVADSNGTEKERYRFIPSPNGKVLIYEEPIRDENGNIVPNLYVAGIDSIDQGVNQSTGQKDVSDYCLVIKKRNYGLSGNKYVCIYKDRPLDIRSAYNQTIKLLEYYGCKAVLEDSRTAIVNHFSDKGKQNLLMKKLQSTQSSDVSRKKAVNSKMYGVYPSTKTIEYYLELIADYVNEYYHEIDSVEMLEELQGYSFEAKRKFDIIAAMGMCEMGDVELRRLGDIGQKAVRSNIKKFGYYYDSDGVKHYGKIPSPDNIPDDLRDLINSMNGR